MQSPSGAARGAVDVSPVDAGPRWSGAIEGIFAFNSGRVIATCRAALASAFFFALLFDPQKPGSSMGAAYGLLGAYVVLSFALLGVAWNDWWRDHRLAEPALVADALAFVGAVFVSESLASDFTSPFLAFFTYLLFTAAIRQGWRKAMLAGLAISSLYVAASISLAIIDFDLDMVRVIRRTLYMLVLTIIIGWFSLQRREQRVDHFSEPPLAETGGNVPLEAALEYAARQARAKAGVIAWLDFEEPHVQMLGLVSRDVAVLGPEVFDGDTGFGTSVRLFDRVRGHLLRSNADGSVGSSKGTVDEPLAVLCSVDVALAVPFSGPTGRGEIMLWDIEGLSVDHVQLGVPIAREISAAFDRQAGLVLASERALARLRDALARDLHDSVAQSLAGASLRLEALRAWLAKGGDPAPEIEAMKRSLRDEQGHVRSLIDRLRSGTYAPGMVEAGAAVRSVIPALEAQWGISVVVGGNGHPIAIPQGIAHEVSHILREAVANAVRHGDAKKVTIRMAGTGTVLVLMIDDDGTGFPDTGGEVQPWTIRERVLGVGGSLEVPQVPHGAVLEIVLPLERQA